MNQCDRWGDIRKISQIGCGGFANVYKIEYNDDIYAMKQIDLEQSSDELQQAQREIQMMSVLDHINIVKYYFSFVWKSSLNVVMELCHCSLRDIIIQQPSSEKQIAFVAKQVLLGLEYLHSQNIIHRDVKPANVLITQGFTCRLCDFGVSGKTSRTFGDKRMSSVGTPHYAAPEQISGRGASYTADLYSLGVMVAEMATQHVLFENETPQSLIKKISDKSFHPFREFLTIDTKASKQFKDFVEILLQTEPTKRQSASQLLKHKFILLNQCQAQECGLFDILNRCVLNVRLKQVECVKVSPNSSPRMNRQDWDFSDDSNQKSQSNVSKARLLAAFDHAGIDIEKHVNISDHQAQQIVKELLKSVHHDNVTSAKSYNSNNPCDSDCAEILDAIRSMK